MIQVTFKIIISFFAADLLTGIVHWWEDTYGNPNWKLLGESVIIPNLQHHKMPRAFIKGTYWSRINTSLGLGVILIVLCWVCSILNFYTVFAILLAAHGNEFHRFAHQTIKENGKVITALQRLGILQSRRHHGLHHQSPYVHNYCVVTNYLNPVLELICFWTILELMLKWVFGVKVLRNSELRNGL